MPVPSLSLPLQGSLGSIILFRMTLPLAVLPLMGFPGSSVGKESPAMQETPVQVLGQEDPLEKR